MTPCAYYSRYFREGKEGGGAEGEIREGRNKREGEGNEEEELGK